MGWAKPMTAGARLIDSEMPGRLGRVGIQYYMLANLVCPARQYGRLVSGGQSYKLGPNT